MRRMGVGSNLDHNLWAPTGETGTRSGFRRAATPEMTQGDRNPGIE
jgi:hypothetical protein